MVSGRPRNGLDGLETAGEAGSEDSMTSRGASALPCVSRGSPAHGIAANKKGDTRVSSFPPFNNDVSLLPR
jgi:hypothetical protein